MKFMYKEKDTIKYDQDYLKVHVEVNNQFWHLYGFFGQNENIKQFAEGFDIR